MLKMNAGLVESATAGTGPLETAASYHTRDNRPRIAAVAAIDVSVLPLCNAIETLRKSGKCGNAVALGSRPTIGAEGISILRQ
jgi:hypothetical protein